MKKLVEKFSWLQLLLGMILIAIGVLTIVLVANAKDGEDFEKTICLVWSIVLFVIGGIIVLVDVLAFSKTAEFSGLIGAGICVGIGVFVLVNKEIISQVITTLLPYILISIGGVLLLKTLILAFKRISFKEWLLPFVLAVIFLASGIVFLCVAEMKKVIYIFFGVLLIVLGAVEIAGYISFLANRRAQRKAAEANSVPDKPSRKEKKKAKKKPEDVVFEDSNDETVVDATPKQIEAEDDVKQIEAQDDIKQIG